MSVRTCLAAFLAVLLVHGLGRAAPPTLELSATTERTHVPFLLKEDAGGRATLDEVRGEGSGWQTPDSVVPNLGTSGSAWWLRFQMTAPPGETEDWVLSVSWALIDDATLYILSPDGTAEPIEGGRLAPTEQRSILYRNPAFVFEVPAGETREYLLRIRGERTMLLPVEIFSSEGFAAKRSRENLLIGAFFGILALITVSGALAFVLLREPMFLWYAFMVGSFALWQASTFGLLSAYVWPASAFLIERALHLLGIAFGIGQTLFTRSYLATRERLPRLDALLFPAGVWAVAGLTVWTLLWPGPALVIGVVLMTVIAATWSIGVALVSLRQGYRPAQSYLAAWFVGCIAATAQALRAVGWVPSNLFTDFGLQISVLVTFVALWLGLIDRMVGIRSDLDRSEEDIRRLEREDAAKRTFLATASHDLRQPLHAVGLLLGALRPDLTTPRSVDLLEKIESATTEMGDMFNALLDISRLDAGLVQARPVAVPLGELLARLGDEFAVQAKNKGLAFEWTTIEATVLSDPLLLARILRNLLTNALRYTDEGTIRLEAEARDSEIAIVVSDTGRGIPDEAKEEIFEPFRRAGPETDAGEALGLGLAIVHRLAGLLNHRVALDSERGKGTSFTLYLERAADSLRPLPPAPVDDAPPPGERVLVIDDDPAVRTGMQSQLQAWGYEVRIAASTTEAESLLDGWTPDVLFADYQLGAGVTGIEAIESVRKKTGRDVPALVVSGDTSAALAEAVREHGLLLLTKPVPPTRLRMALDYAKRNRQDRRG